MAAAREWQLALLVALLGLLVDLGTCGTFTLNNNCGSTVWVGAQSNAGVAPLQLGSKARLDTGQSLTVSVPSSWGGRFWGRTGCNFGSGNGGTGVACTTGDCGNGALDCGGSGGKPPATLAEFTLAGYNNNDFYDVSLVDGYNLPLAVFPTQGGSSRNASDDKSCGTAGCTGDLNQSCPSQLRITADGNTVGCRSACDALGGSQYCCTGANGSPNTCPPTDYSKTFKSACPKAYSYAYDDASSIFTCKSGAYTITFCPTSLPQIPQDLTTPPTVDVPAAPATPAVTDPAPATPAVTDPAPPSGDVPSSSTGVPSTGEVPSSSSGEVPAGPASESGVPAIPATGGVPDPGTDGATYSTVGTNFRIVTQSSQAAAGVNAVSWLLLLLCLGLLQAATTLRVSPA